MNKLLLAAPLFILLVVAVILVRSGEESVSSCADYASLEPQATPQATLELELQMLQNGEYCYQLPIFDEAWQQQGTFENGPRFDSIAEKVPAQSETLVIDDLALVYYPDHPERGPDFLFRNDRGWVIDRTAVRESVIYNANGASWYVNESADEYLPLVEEIYNEE